MQILAFACCTVYLNIVSMLSALPWYTKTAARLSSDLLNQNIVTLPWPARSPDLVPIELVWDILACNVRYNHDVRPRVQIITALCLEWAAVHQNDIITIIGLMRHHSTACMRPDGGLTSN